MTGAPTDTRTACECCEKAAKRERPDISRDVYNSFCPACNRRADADRNFHQKQGRGAA